ncbi:MULTISPECIES: hypothetical protein [Pseudomonas]|uniref:hypothetical protein n=1 Tax=Pseudomonas TaxID=286 RepID=UPI00249A17D0|nr:MULTISPECIES: hypothetical protein [Pseudomonas]
MRRSLIALTLACLAGLPPTVSAQQPDGYAVLIVSRDRLELASLCDIGVYLQDELAARLMPGQEAAFNLPPGALSIRVDSISGPGPCKPGMLRPSPQRIDLRAGEIRHYDLALGVGGYYLQAGNR